jgi:hypothetical protein
MKLATVSAGVVFDMRSPVWAKRPQWAPSLLTPWWQHAAGQADGVPPSRPVRIPACEPQERFVIAVIWIVFGVLLAAWTVVIWLSAAVTSWAAEALQAGAAGAGVTVPDVVARLPDWLKNAIPGDLLELLPEWLASLQKSIALVESVLPWAGEAIGWLVPLLWVGWFVVALGMAALALLVHVIVRRSTRASPPTPVL